jgi:hypothetical protein
MLSGVVIVENREKLARNLIWSKPQFAKGYAIISEKLNELKNLKFIEIRKNTIYGKKQQSTLEEKILKLK